jgi:hypothetical protein
MAPGDSATVRADQTGGLIVRHQRHVLSFDNGDVIVLWVENGGDREPGQIRKCVAVTGALATKFGWACHDPGLTAVVFSEVRDNARTAFLLAGPPETTHFVVGTEGRQIGVIPIDGYAVLTEAGSVCATLVEAWEGDELLRSEPSSAC